MSQIDVPTLVNWIVTGVIGLVFGIVSASVVHRYQRRRDDIAWDREKLLQQQKFDQEKSQLQERFRHERAGWEAGFLERQRQAVLEAEQKKRNDLRAQLTSGVSDPAKAIRSIKQADRLIAIHDNVTPDSMRSSARSAVDVASELHRLAVELEVWYAIADNAAGPMSAREAPFTFRNWQEYYFELMRSASMLTRAADILATTANLVDETDASNTTSLEKAQD